LGLWPGLKHRGEINPDEVLLENKNAPIYGAAGYNNGTVARPLANLTSGPVLNDMTLASMTTQRQGKAPS
jgi:hypothetical protein